MKKLFYHIAAAVIILFAQSCKKDLEPVPYKLTVNEVDIQLEPSGYTVVTLDSLIIHPIITESKPEGHRFSYSWQVWPNLGDGEMQELSTERDLRIKVVLAPKDYRIRLIVKDEETGVSYIEHSYVSVISPFSEGWLVSHNVAGKGNLAFIRSLDDEVFVSPISDVNRKEYAEAISAYNAVWAFNDSYQQIIFFTKTGAYRFDSQSFVELTDNNKLFYDGGPSTFGTNAVYGYDGRGAMQAIINNGGVYATNAIDIFYGFSFDEKFSPRLPGEYNAFPYVFKFGAIGTTLGFYDNNSKSFKLIDRTLAVTNPAATSGLTDIGKTLIAADLGPAQEYFLVLKDENNKRYLFTFSGASSLHNPAAHKDQEMLNCPELENAIHFTSSRSAKLLYYCTSNNIYLYDANANSAKLIYSFPAGYVIKDLQMLKETYKQIEYSSAYHNKRLVVGVDNGTQGEVYYLDLNTIGEVINNTFSKKFTGFGQITHLNVKSPY